MTFDTLKFANRLKAAGVSTAHAEAESEALSEVFKHNFNELATKADLKNEIKDVRKDMFLMEERLNYKMDKMMLQITVRMGGMIAAGIAILIALKQF